MTYGRVDNNQREIVEALRQVGASVESLAEVGNGCPDLLVGLRGRNYLLEVKRPRGRVYKSQADWHQRWHGQVAIVHTVEEALAVIGLGSVMAEERLERIIGAFPDLDITHEA